MKKVAQLRLSHIDDHMNKYEEVYIESILTVDIIFSSAIPVASILKWKAKYQIMTCTTVLKVC